MTPPKNRHGKVIRLHDHKIDEYKRLHTAVWPGVETMIHECHLEHFSIFLRQLPDQRHYLFMFFEYTGTDYDADMARMAAHPETQRWWELTDACQDPLPNRTPGEWWADMEPVCLLPSP
jgi:L-rhamnose mutarotase